MRSGKIKNTILTLFTLAFIIFALGCVVIGCMVFYHAITNPELTATQNFLWIFESKFRSVCMIGAIISYFGIAALGRK